MYHLYHLRYTHQRPDRWPLIRRSALDADIWYSEFRKCQSRNMDPSPEALICWRTCLFKDKTWFWDSRSLLRNVDTWEILGTDNTPSDMHPNRPGMTQGVLYSLWRWGVTFWMWDVSHETPDVTPCRTSPPLPVFLYMSRAKRLT